MNEIGKNLLRQVKESLSVRDSNPEVYASAFTEAKRFITATINGKLEFIPLNLLAVTKGRVLVELEVAYVFGQPEQRPDLDDHLIKFYTDHGLKRILTGYDEAVEYYIKPIDAQPLKRADTFFQQGVIEKLSAYAGKKYLASDPFLKDLGAQYAEFIMQPTNKWGADVLMPGYELETERYWQVAGRFKTFTWAKLYREEYRDKQIFFSVGLDVVNEEFVIKLDCLRSGTNKLSNGDIRKFDLYLKDIETEHRIPVAYSDLLNWNTLNQAARSVFEDLEQDYLNVVKYIFLDDCDLSERENCLYPLSADYKSEIEPSTKIEQAELIELVMEYEKFNLAHAGKQELADQVSHAIESAANVNSFELDGFEKHILVKGVSGGTSSSIQISDEEISALTNRDHMYFYQVVEFDEIRRCGKLIIRKGDPGKYSTLTPRIFDLNVS